VKLRRNYKLDAPRAVAGRNSDNTMIQRILGWQPGTPLWDGLAKTYAWIEGQYRDRKAGKRTVKGYDLKELSAVSFSSEHLD